MSRRGRPAPAPATPTAVLVAVALSVVAIILAATALLVTLSRGNGLPAPTSDPGVAAATATFTPLPTLAPGTTADDTAGASPGPTSIHAAPDLEALLPHSVNGVTLVSQSTTGTAGLGTDPGSQALIASLAGLGKTPADLDIAEAYDETSTIDVSITGFRATGVDASRLAAAIIASWQAGGASGITTSSSTIGQKPVITVDYGDGGADDYVYVHGAVVFDVATSDPDLATQVLTQLP